MKNIAWTPIADIKGRAPVRVHLRAPLIDAVTLLRERRRGAVVVEDDDGRMAGIFTERDLITRVDHQDHRWHTLPVQDYMTRDPRAIPQSGTVADAVRLMRQGTFRHLPIIDDDRRVVGILSIRDILAHIAEHYPKEFLNLPPDPDHEATERWGG